MRMKSVQSSESRGSREEEKLSPRQLIPEAVSECPSTSPGSALLEDEEKKAHELKKRSSLSKLKKAKASAIVATASHRLRKVSLETPLGQKILCWSRPAATVMRWSRPADVVCPAPLSRLARMNAMDAQISARDAAGILVCRMNSDGAGSGFGALGYPSPPPGKDLPRRTAEQRKKYKRKPLRLPVVLKPAGGSAARSKTASPSTAKTHLPAVVSAPNRLTGTQ